MVDAFVESVDLHLMADVPLGLMLSEGVDSAAVAWAAAEAGRKLDCFTLDFLGSPGEGAGAARIAEAYGHSHHVLGADPDVESLVDDYLTHVDRPTCDGLNVLLVSNAIRAAGIKVALAGTGETRSWPDMDTTDRGGCLATRQVGAPARRPEQACDSCQVVVASVPLGSGNSGQGLTRNCWRDCTGWRGGPQR